MKCRARLPWNSDPCPNEVEAEHGETFQLDGVEMCWECFDCLSEIERDRTGRDRDDFWLEEDGR